MFRPAQSGVDVARSLPRHHPRWRPTFMKPDAGTGSLPRGRSWGNHIGTVRGRNGHLDSVKPIRRQRFPLNPGQSHQIPQFPVPSADAQ